MAKTNTMAILSLIFAFVFAPVGIVLGFISLNQIKQSKEEGRGLAIAGIIVGFAPFVIILLVMILGLLLGGVRAAL